MTDCVPSKEIKTKISQKTNSNELAVPEDYPTETAPCELAVLQ